MLFSCENDLGAIQEVTTSPEMADEVVNDMHTLYSDSGVVVYEMMATRMEQFGPPKNIRLFKDGFQVNFFKEKDSIVSTLTAEYAEIREKENVIIARNNVIFTNYEKKQTLKTEELYWDQTAKRVRTEKHFEVIGEKTTVSGYGLDTDENFTDYKMHKVSAESQNTNNNDSIQ